MIWSILDKNCDGIIAPVKEGKRSIQRIKTAEIKMLDTENDDSIQIGKHKFSKEVFEWAREQLRESILSEADYVIIDEIGKLELNNSGYEPVVSYLINEFLKTDRFNLVLVIRESLVDEITAKYGLKNFEILNSLK